MTSASLTPVLESIDGVDVGVAGDLSGIQFVAYFGYVGIGR